jgi:hypothetical protein
LTGSADSSKEDRGNSQGQIGVRHDNRCCQGDRYALSL